MLGPFARTLCFCTNRLRKCEKVEFHHNLLSWVQKMHLPTKNIDFQTGNSTTRTALAGVFPGSKTEIAEGLFPCNSGVQWRSIWNKLNFLFFNPLRRFLRV